MLHLLTVIVGIWVRHACFWLSELKLLHRWCFSFKLVTKLFFRTHNKIIALHWGMESYKDRWIFHGIWEIFSFLMKKLAFIWRCRISVLEDDKGEYSGMIRDRKLEAARKEREGIWSELVANAGLMRALVFFSLYMRRTLNGHSIFLATNSVYSISEWSFETTVIWNSCPGVNLLLMPVSHQA